MKKYFIISFLFFSIELFGQVKFDLMPTNMMNYVGKIKKDSLDKLIGLPFEEAEGFYYYEVENIYDNEITGLQCFFREKDGILISVRFPTKNYLGYWIDFTKIEGYPKKSSIAQSKGLMKIKKDAFNNMESLDLKYNHFGCQFRNFVNHGDIKTAVINYHTY